LRNAISNSAKHIERNLQLYTLGEVDEAWIKEKNGPIKQHKEVAEKELDSL
jgi:UDP-2,3-diacylglucosamine pyrophosphatase LpxH